MSARGDDRRGEVLIISTHNLSRLNGVLLAGFLRLSGVTRLTRVEWGIVLEATSRRDGSIYAKLVEITRETDNNGAPHGIG